MEQWKDIPNYSGYQVSDLGRIRTYNKTTYTKKHGIRHWQNRIIKQKLQIRKNNGRTDYRVELWNNGKHKTILVARLVAFTFFEEDINNTKLTVNHIDGNSENNKLVNLEIVSLKENIRHGFRTGLINCSKKIKIEDKSTGTIIYPSSLSEGSKLINHNPGYLSLKLKRNKFENERYRWQLL